MRKSYPSKNDLPGERKISNSLFKKSPFSRHPELRGNMGGVMYGQLIAHDFGMRLMYQTSKYFTIVMKRMKSFLHLS